MDGPNPYADRRPKPLRRPQTKTLTQTIGASGSSLQEMKIIEVGGTRRSCRPSSVPSNLVISVAEGRHGLPNPYTHIKKCHIAETHKEILDWLRATEDGAHKVNKLVKLATELLLSHDKIRIQCIGGKHRSQVIAREVAKQVPGCELELLDAPALAD